jgi:hypothetical protein
MTSFGIFSLRGTIKERSEKCERNSLRWAQAACKDLKYSPTKVREEILIAKSSGFFI